MAETLLHKIVSLVAVYWCCPSVFRFDLSLPAAICIQPGHNYPQPEENAPCDPFMLLDARSTLNWLESLSVPQYGPLKERAVIKLWLFGFSYTKRGSLKHLVASSSLIQALFVYSDFFHTYQQKRMNCRMENTHWLLMLYLNIYTSVSTVETISGVQQSSEQSRRQKETSWVWDHLLLVICEDLERCFTWLLEDGV